MGTSEIFEPRLRVFLKELEALCVRHEVCLDTYPGEEVRICDRTPDDRRSLEGCHVVDDTDERPGVALLPGSRET